MEILHTVFSPTRLVTSADLPALRRLCDQCVGTGLYSETDLQELLARPDGVCVVQEDGEGQLAGYCLGFLTSAAEAADIIKQSAADISLWAKTPQPVVGICKSLGVDEGHRGRGLALELQGYCAEAMLSRGADLLFGVAWRQGTSIPVAQTLLALGFTYLCDSQHVWYDAAGLDCPVCKQPRCVCPAAIFVKRSGNL
ncbi:MAG: GNAT family N-acetyltransferase [Oscillospiraceae bacterium]